MFFGTLSTVQLMSAVRVVSYTVFLKVQEESLMSMPGPMEIIVILVVVLLLFGAKRLPEIGRALGEGIREFKKSIKGLDDDGQDKKNPGA